MRSLPACGVVFFLLLLLSSGYGGEVSATQSPPVSPVPAVKPPDSLPPKVSEQPDKTPIVSSVPPAPIVEANAPSIHKETPVPLAPSETSRKVKAIVERVIDALLDMNGVTLFGLAAVIAMLVFYTFEDRSPFFILSFATACWIGSACAFVLWPWPFGMAGTIWGFIAVRKWWLETKSKNGGIAGIGNGEHPVLLWPTRFVYILAVICAVILLIVDSPAAAGLSLPISRSVVEAVLLLLVGIAFLGWLAISRPSTLDLIKQALIAAAFILWGIDLLLPSGSWTTFIGAIVISIYVGDLAWLMEGNFRKQFGVHAPRAMNGSSDTDCGAAGVCQSCGSPAPHRTVA
jgi:hypothetical protein